MRRPRLDGPDTFERRPQVTLVSAPPGAGKTTLLASWSAAPRPDPVGWLSLDRRDNEPRRVAGLVVAALERAGALPDFAPADLDGDTLLDAAFEHLMGRGRRCVLMMDDLQEISSGPALRTLAHLVGRAPGVLDLVLASRADPPIGWARLQLDGRLRQVRNAELSFRPDEAAQLFAAHGVRLGRDDTRLLCERTEGWAAGLRLAACALQSDAEPHRFVLSTSATQAAVSEYLLKEVLVREDEAAQQFLLRTSVADRLTPDLAVALTGDARAGERLVALERRGIFLVELDESGAYRYHALFGALLRARLRLQDAELFSELHHRAARWHVAHEMPLEAEEHARAAGDWPLLGQLLLVRWLDAALDGDHPAEDLVSDLPPPVVLRVPELALVAAAEACRHARHEDADVYRDALDEATTLDETDVTEGAEAATWQVARLVLDMARGRAFGDGARSRAAVRTLSTRSAVDGWTSRTRRLATLRGAELAVGAGAFDRARAPLEDLAGDPDSGWLGIDATALLALLDAADGDLRRAEERAGTVLVGDGAHRGDAARVANLAVAICATQRGEPKGAVDALDAAAGEPAPAWGVVRSVERVMQASPRSRSPVVPGVGARTLGGALVQRVLVALGVLDVIDPDGRAVRVGGDGERMVVRARRWVQTGADGRSPAGVDGTDQGAHPRTMIEARVLAALLAEGQGDKPRVLRHLDAALDLAAATGIRAPLDAYGARLAPLIERHVMDLAAHAGLALELVDRLAPTHAAALVEPLTDREREVLHHLPTLMSNVEIADGMRLSVNTVKTHLKAIYRKLGVEGRRQAVLRGRDLELM